MVDDDYYTKTLQFADINYELADEEEQENIFRKYCDFLNTFENNIEIQFTYQNKTIDEAKFKKDITMPKKHYEDKQLEGLHHEYQQMLYDQFDGCSNGTTKVKYLTFGVHESDFKRAQNILNRTEMEITRKFKKMFVKVTPLNGHDRLKLLKDSLHPLQVMPFNFDWKSRYESGISVKDSIAPTSMDFSKLDTFRIGRTIGRAYFIMIDSAEISDRIVEELMDTDGNISVNIHTHSENQSKARKFTSQKMTTIKGVKVGIQKKAAQKGYDGDSALSMDLESEIDSCESVYNAISRRNQRLFITTILVTVYGHNINEILSIENDLNSVTQKYNCELKILDDLQEQGAMSSLPLGVNKVPINRPFITTELATFMPFTSQDVFTPNATYYGCNPLTRKMITINRKALINLGGLILGMAGTGKSFTAKREILDVFFRTLDSIIICDPEAEYIELTKSLNGTIIDISATSQNHLNPFDINLKSDEKEDDPVTIKSQFILSFIEAGISSKYGLSAAEKSIIDRCVKKIYEKYIEDPTPENMPIFKDLYDELRKTNNEHARNVADSIEIFVTGSLSIFNHRTNVSVDNRVLCFNIKKLSNHLHKMGMLVIMDYVWNKVSQGRTDKKHTHFYVDEFHLLLRDDLTAEYSVNMWKRFRKYHALPTGITQNVTDILLSPEVENILKNSAFITLLGQASGDREIIAERLGISPQEMEYITDTGCGEGLIYYNEKNDNQVGGGSVIPFKDSFPTDTETFKIITTSYDD